MHDPEFVELVKAGLAHLSEEITEDLPRMGKTIQAWMKDLAGSPEPAEYFLQPVAFPLMLLPWWVERQLMGDYDPNFQMSLVTSNAALYYSIRMIDNVMDNHATIESKLLPISGYFIDRFKSVYQELFPPTDPFWEFFRRTWAESGDVTAADGHLLDVDRSTFTSLVSHKVCAAKIGVAAVCYRYHRPGLLPLWSRWINTFGCWHVFREDMFDWQQDLELGSATYFLCEAGRQKHPGELAVDWLARTGLDWGLAQLDGWMEELEHMTFVPEEVRSYLEFREREVFQQRAVILPALKTIRQPSESNANE